MWQAGDGGECDLDAQVRELREALVKLAANVMWRSGVAMAVQVARGTTANQSEEVVEPTVEVVEESDRMVVLPEIRDAGDAGEADRTEVLSVDKHPGGGTLVARLIGWTCCRRSRILVVLARLMAGTSCQMS